VRLDIDRRTPEVWLDRAAFKGAILNLLDNAAKYSRERKEIEVRVAYIEEGAVDAAGGRGSALGAAVAPNGAAGASDEAAGAVEIRVRDHGIGIQAAETVKIFEAFYRVEKGLEQEVQGAGLGLALVKHVVEAHGGAIGVESSRGEGSEFTIRLPVRERPPAPARARNGAELGRRGARLGWKPVAPRRGA
jgi:signal transduction histidine kinase